MKIQNIRYGFATNSSSTHSIVVINNGAPNVPVDNQSFDWKNFTLSDYNDKLEYLGQVLRQSFESSCGLGEKEAALLASDWLGIEVDPSGYIDHQSFMCIPRSMDVNNKMPNRKLIEALKKELKRNDVVILGGNDNSNGHPLSVIGRLAPGFSSLPDEYFARSWVSKYDETFDYWTLFNTVRGTKVRFTFDERVITKSSTPDLVDLKITNQCMRNCKYCYQNSSAQGKHANFNVIYNIAHTLSSCGVLEVAIGGGEPTLHPDFFRILETFNQCNIVPNFSTRDISFVINNIIALRSLGVGSIGMSVDNSDEAEKVQKDFSSVSGVSTNIVLHHIVGTTPPDDLFKIFQVAALCNNRVYSNSSWNCLPLLLLGYKTAGRGSTYSPYQFDLMEQIMKYNEDHYCAVGMDTMLVDQYKDALKGVSQEVYWSDGEGLFSFYIDAVTEQMGNSSYEPECLVPLITNTDEFKKMYALSPEDRVVKEIIE